MTRAPEAARANDEGSSPRASAWPEPRTAVVTGAASPRGIGRATAERLARNGWSVAIVDIDGAAARELSTELSTRHGVPCLGIEADIADETSVDGAAREIVRALPPVVGLANIAGVSSPTSFLDVTAKEWDHVFDINIRGTFLITRALVPSMAEKGVGRVVSVSSASAQRGGGTYSKVAYSASKAAVLGFTRALARELGPSGITVNAVSPGPIDTDIMGGTLSEERKRQLVAELPVGRLGVVEDVAAVIDFLMSADAGYITGSTYNVNGGLIID